jgi:hypothetical protein
MVSDSMGTPSNHPKPALPQRPSGNTEEISINNRNTGQQQPTVAPNNVSFGAGKYSQMPRSFTGSTHTPSIMGRSSFEVTSDKSPLLSSRASGASGTYGLERQRPLSTQSRGSGNSRHQVTQQQQLPFGLGQSGHAPSGSRSTGNEAVQGDNGGKSSMFTRFRRR